jgi:hypothetical protein
MKRHAFDPVAFIFGIVFLAVGIPMAFSDRGLTLFEGRWVAPAVLIVAGVVVLLSTRGRQGQDEPVLPEESAESDLIR